VLLLYEAMPRPYANQHQVHGHCQQASFESSEKFSSKADSLLFFFSSSIVSTNWRNDEKVFSKKKKFHLEKETVVKERKCCWRQRQTFQTQRKDERETKRDGESV